MQKEIYMKLKYFILATCHAPHVLVLLLRNCANLGNIYNLSEIELTFLKLSLVTGVALLLKLIATTFMFFFSCQQSVCALKFFMVLYLIDLLAGTAICLDSFISRELWKPHLTEDIHNVSVVEIAYISLVGIMIFVDGFNLAITYKAIQGGYFRKRTIMSKEFKTYLKTTSLRVNRSTGKTERKKEETKMIVIK